MRSPFRKHGRAPALVVWVMLAAPVVLACSVPVFRYALERWAADPYVVIVLHRGPLAGDDLAVVEWLRKFERVENAPPYLIVETVDLAELPEEPAEPTEDSAKGPAEAPAGPARELASPTPPASGDADPREAWMRELVAAAEGKPLPWVIVRYPLTARIPVPAWEGRLTPGAARALVDSPLRRDIAQRLVKGDSAVWVLLEIGDKAKDDAAAKLLQEQLAQMEKALELPDMTGDPVAEQMFGDEAPPLRVAFSLVRLARDNAAEQMLIQMLLRSEEDLPTLQEPMVFPIFGRGRALFALVGEGINEGNIQDTCGFLAGPCSCQVKWQNPGTDLLMAVPWDAMLYEQGTLPPLPAGLPSPPPAAVVKAAKEDTEAQVSRKPFRGALVRNSIVAMVAAVVVAGVAGLAWRRATRHARG